MWTDGTIAPLEALGEAANALVEDFFLFKNLSGTGGIASSRPALSLSPEIYQTPIERLELSHRTLNCLKRAHITRVGEVLQMSDDELLKIRNFGEKSLSELRSKLAEQGVSDESESEETGAELAGGDGEEGLDGISLIQTSQGGSVMDALSGISMPEDADDEDLDDDLEFDFDDDEEDC